MNQVDRGSDEYLLDQCQRFLREQPDVADAAERDRLLQIVENLEAGLPVLSELRSVGLDLKRLNDLGSVRDVRPYVHILEKWWRKTDNDTTKSILISALKPYARHLMPEMLAEMRRKHHRGSIYGESLGSAIHAFAGKMHVDEMVSILRDRSIPAPNRYALVRTVGKFAIPSMVPLLSSLLMEPEMAGPSVLDALGRTRSREALEIVAAYTSHENKWVREAAQRAVARLEADLAEEAAAAEGRPSARPARPPRPKDWTVAFYAQPDRAAESRATFLTRLLGLGWQPEPLRDRSFVYENEPTGVKARLAEHREPAVDGLTSLDLRLSIAQPRPSFWGAEAIPALDQATAEAGIRTVIGGIEVEVGSLLLNWRAANELAIASFGAGKPRMTREQAQRWWRYQFALEKLRARFEPEAFVPQLLPFVQGKDPVVRFIVAWPEAIPIVLPPCDGVSLGRAGLFGLEAAGVASYQDVRSLLHGRLKRERVDGFELEVLWPNDDGTTGDVADLIKSLPVVPQGKFRRLAFDAFLDPID